MSADQASLFAADDFEPEPEMVDASAGTMAAHTELEDGAIWVDLGGPIRWLRMTPEDARGWAVKLEQLAREAEEA